LDPTPHIADHVDAHLMQMLRRPTPKLQQLRRPKRPARHDHLAARLGYCGPAGVWYSTPVALPFSITTRVACAFVAIVRLAGACDRYALARSSAACERGVW